MFGLPSVEASVEDVKRRWGNQNKARPLKLELTRWSTDVQIACALGTHHLVCQFSDRHHSYHSLYSCHSYHILPTSYHISSIPPVLLPSPDSIDRERRRVCGASPPPLPRGAQPLPRRDAAAGRVFAVRLHGGVSHALVVGRPVAAGGGSVVRSMG